MVTIIAMRIITNLFMSYYAVKTITYFITLKRDFTNMTSQNLIVLTAMLIEFCNRLYCYLVTDEVNIAKFFMQVCAYPLVSYLWHSSKGMGAPLRELFDILLISYLVYHQHLQNLRKVKKQAQNFFNAVGLNENVT